MSTICTGVLTHVVLSDKANKYNLLIVWICKSSCVHVAASCVCETKPNRTYEDRGRQREWMGGLEGQSTQQIL